MPDGAYNDFIEEYGSKCQWDLLRYHKWGDWDDLFCDIKTYWNTKAVRAFEQSLLIRITSIWARGVLGMQR